MARLLCTQSLIHVLDGVLLPDALPGLASQPGKLAGESSGAAPGHALRGWLIAMPAFAVATLVWSLSSSGGALS
jgi:hypothetical protein